MSIDFAIGFIFWEISCFQIKGHSVVMGETGKDGDEYRSRASKNMFLIILPIGPGKEQAFSLTILWSNQISDGGIN